MGAGISKEQERKAKYNSLKRVERELKKAGVHCEYGNKSVYGISPIGETPWGFTVSYGTTLRASNGECFGNMHVEVRGEHYSLLDAQTGINRIKALYGNEGYNLPETELALLVVKVNDALRREHGTGSDPNFYDVFLHDADGNRVAKNHGMVFCYNEMQNGKPMLRLGTCNTDYVEFAPGMSVRHRDGIIIVQR